MHPPSSLTDSLVVLFRVAILISTGFLCFRLLQSKLYRKYRFFFTFLVFSGVRAVAGLAFRTGDTSYFYLWRYTEPVYWLFYILLVVEVYSLVLQRFTGIRSLSRWALGVAVCISVLLSGISLIALFKDPLHPSLILFHYLRIERCVDVGLVIFLLLLLFLLSWYPIPLSRNILTHCALYSIYLICHSLGLFIRDLQGWQITEWLNVTLLAITASCLIAWSILLNPQGEKETRAMLPAHDPEQETRLIAQLNSLNSTIMRAAKNRPSVT